MAKITNTGSATNKSTELGGNYKILSLNNLALESASDTLTLSDLDNGLSSIQNVIITPTIQSTTTTYASASYSGLVITITTAAQAGGASTVWGAVNLLVIGA